MGLGDIVDGLKSRLPFLNKDGDSTEDIDFGSDSLDFGKDAPQEGATEPVETPGSESPFMDEPPQGSEEQAPFAQPPAQAQPQFGGQQKPDPFQPPMQPVPSAPPAPTSDSLKIDIDNIKQRIENLMHKFETISAELDTVRSENEFEKALLQRYDFYLRDIVTKIDNMEKQHEAMLSEMHSKK